MRSSRLLPVDPARVFLVLALLLGGVYSVIVPYGAGFDEEQHLVRIYDISGNYLLPNRNPPYYNSTVTYREFIDLSYQRRFVQSPASDTFRPEVWGRRLSRLEEDTLYSFETRSIYSPVIFFPQAALAKIFWRRLDLPILPTVMLMRFAGLMVYVAACYFAIRITPAGKWTLAALALAPMALYQASTLSADGFTNGVSILFIGLVLFVYGSGTPPASKWMWALMAGSFLLGFAKPGTFLLLPLLLILPGERFASRRWIMLLLTGALLAIVFNIGWTALSIPNSNFSEGQSQGVSEKLGLILSAPGGFLVTFVRNLSSSLLPYYKDWVGVYGHWAGIVPASVYWSFTVLLAITVLMDVPTIRFDKRIRLYMAVLSLVSSLAVMGMFFVANYSPGAANILGRQGRYFIPFAPLLFVALSGWVQAPGSWMKPLQWLAAGAFVLALGYYTLGLYAVYYTDCGYATFTGGQCRIPVYKNLDKTGGRKIQLSATSDIRQTFLAKCSGLEAVQVLVKAVPQSGGGSIHISLNDGTGVPLAAREIPVAEIRAGEYLTLPLDLPTNGRGIWYEVRLEAVGLNPLQEFGIGSDWSDFYDGGLFVAGQPRQGDLLIRYFCPRP